MDFTCRGMLHNMSAPPKTTITYAGLADLAGGAKSEAPKRSNKPAKTARLVALRVSLPGCFPTEPEDILRTLGIDHGTDPATTLDELIEQRALQLPLPDGCLVLPMEMANRELATDPLTALAIVTKCSEFVWLRHKTPSLGRLERVTSATLYVPAAAADAMKEELK